MTKPAFTPGPWSVSNRAEILAGRDKDGDDIVLASVGVSSGFRSHTHAIVKAQSEKGKANAHLIAASPILYAVLQDCEEWLRVMLEQQLIPQGSDGAKHIKATVARARAALSKARGES